MALDPQFKAFFEQMKDQPSPEALIRTYTVEQLRTMRHPRKQEVEPVGRTEDLTLPGPGGPVPVRLYVPDRDGPLPALVYFHGGGYVFGSLEEADAFCRILVNRAGCAVLSVGYRLAPEHPFPAAVDDADTAVHWMAEHASELGIDPARIGVGGDSAGGALATVVCALARERGPEFELVGQLLISPCTVIDYDAPSRSEFANGPGLTTMGAMWAYSQYLPDPATRTDPRAAPLLADDLSGLPPTLILAAECDPLRDEQRAYADQLRDAGVPTIYSEYPGVVHGWVLYGVQFDAAARAVEEIAAWLGSRLGSLVAVR